MPPSAQDAFAAGLSGTGAVQARWLEVVVAALSAACDPWVLALIALAMFSFLERRVPSVLKAWAPLVVALAVTVFAGAAAKALWGAPRPVGPGADAGLGLELARAALRASGSGGQALVSAVFASYAALVYGRRGLPAVVLAVAGGLVRVHAGAHWVVDVVFGWVAGAAIGLVAWAIVVRLRPGGHLARLRTARAASRGGAATGTDGP